MRISVENTEVKMGYEVSQKVKFCFSNSFKQVLKRLKNVYDFNPILASSEGF